MPRNSQKSAPNILSIPEDTSKVPKQIRVFDLELGGRDGLLGLEYTDSFVHEVEATLWSDFDKEVGELLYSTHRSSPPKKTPPKYGKVSIKPAQRKRTDLSLNAPNEIHENGEIYKKVDLVFMVIRLITKGSPKKEKIKFSTSYAPFSIAENDGGDGLFFNPSFIRKQVDVSDSFLEIAGEDEKPIDAHYADATEAGFVFHYEDDSEETPKEFVYRFNIHLEVANNKRSNDARGSSQGRFYDFIPIIIDPDVGHPGGGYPPTGP